MKQKLIDLKGKINKSTTIVEYLNSRLPTLDRITRQKVKDREEFNTTINQQGLRSKDIHRTLHTMTAEFTFSSTHIAYTKIDQILAIEQMLTNLKYLKSNTVCSMTIMQSN